MPAEWSRVIGIVPDHNAVVVVPFGEEWLRIERVVLDEVNRCIGDSSIMVTRKLVVDGMPQIAFDQHSREDQSMMKEQFSLIEPIVECIDRWLLDPDFLNEKIRSRVKEKKTYRNKVTRPLHRYLEGGSTLTALLKRYPLCGNREEPVEQKKRGPLRKMFAMTGDEKDAGVALSSTIISAFRYAVSRYLKNQIPIKKVYEKMCDDMFNDGYVIDDHGNATPIKRPVGQTPSYRQFKHFVRTKLDVEATARRHLGSHEFKLSGRGIIGKAAQGLFGPTARYEVDATVMDVFIVSELNRAWILGRPVLYVVIDTFSRMVVGFHISMEGPSWKEAQMALYYAFQDKVTFCSQFGKEITTEEWPTAPLPCELKSDRGEWIADAADSGAADLGFKWATPGPCRGDWKSVVERQFRLVNDETIVFVAGAHRKHIRSQSGSRAQNAAALTRRELGKILINHFLIRNHTPVDKDVVPEAMVQANEIDPTPIGIWKWGLENLTGMTRSVDSSEVFRALLPEEKARVRSTGIHFRHLRYTCDTAVSENWFTKARVHSSWQVRIKYDPTDISTIWIHKGDSTGWERCRLVEAEARYHNASLWEALDAVSNLALHKEDSVNATAFSSAKMRAENEAVVAEAMFRTKQAVEGMSAAARMRESAANGELAADVESFLVAASNPDTGIGGSAEKPIGTRSEPELDLGGDAMLRQMDEELARGDL